MILAHHFDLLTYMIKHVVGKAVIEVSDSLRIQLIDRKKQQLRFLIVFELLVYVIFLLWAVSIISNRISWGVISVGGVLFGMMSYSFFISLYKTYKNTKVTILKKENGFILLNQKVVCAEGSFLQVIIQTKSNFYQVVKIYCSVGIQTSTKNIPLSFDHTPENAQKIAIILANYFEKEIVERRLIQIPIFTKW